MITVTAGFAVLAALGSAGCAAVAGTMQHTTAKRGRRADGTATSHVADFARHQLAQALWWLSLCVQAGSLLLHATALRFGSLALVQPVLALVVVLALPLNHRLNRTRLTRTEMVWAAVVTAGMAGFLLTASSGSGAAPIPLRGLLLPAIAAALLVGLCLLLARRTSPHLAALCLGVAAGVAFSLEAALLQTTTGELVTNPLSALATPTPYALVLTGAAGVALTQLAYRAGPLSSALPAIVTVNPVASVLLSALVGAGGIATSPGALAAEVCTLACLVVGVGALARIIEQPDEGARQPTPVATGAPPRSRSS
ncbi:MAG TPA: DMT family transporter [Segeticoccus sp.]|uniref:DMT family transporter n=1 Tax=Segeticoccus sp. TaxID=2706531 RepID=UPI002D7E1FF4|nr:DMT family transporter [Segeticoccus sp.]HET8601613.1 DMT family transporter [Segeticoccus sp.]